MTYVTIPGDCVDRVTAQNGDQVLIEGLATPRPAPKVTLKRNWQSQQQQEQQPQQPISHTDVPSIRKQRATWESKAEVQDDSKHIVEADRVPANPKQSTSQVHVDTHLSDKKVSTNAPVKNEALKKEFTDTNTEAIERIQIGSNKLCIREDLAKEKMVLSQESSQAIFEMGDAELIELKKSMIHCPSCLHNVLKGQFFADAGSTSDPTWI